MILSPQNVWQSLLRNLFFHLHVAYVATPIILLSCVTKSLQDLGIEPLVVEENLMKWLKLGTLWEAIVLIDGICAPMSTHQGLGWSTNVRLEAEVYLEMRNINDLQRNSLVSS